MAYRLSWIAGKSGKHLFLKDIEDEKPPLLLQMVTDYGGLHFMYAMKIILLVSQKEMLVLMLEHVSYFTYAAGQL